MKIDNDKFWLDFLQGKDVGVAKDKHPLHKGSPREDIDDVKDAESLLWYINNPFVAVDVDDFEDALLILKILNDHKKKFICYMSQSRGMHFVFKSSTPLNHKNGINWLGMSVEMKLYGKKSTHVVIKENHQFRKLLRVCTLKEMDPIPFWMLTVKDKKSFPVQRGLSNDDGRNNALFNVQMLAKDCVDCETWVDFCEYANIVNDYIFDEPLPMQELDATILRADVEAMFSVEKEDVIGDYPFFKAKRFLNAKFVDYFLNKYDVVIWEDRIWIYNGEFYDDNDKSLNRALIETYPEISEKQRREIKERLSLKQNLYKRPDRGYVGLQNGLLDFSNPNDIKLVDFTPDFFYVKKVNVPWNESYIQGQIKNPVVDKVLDFVSSGDLEMRNFLLDCVANVLLYDSTYNEICLILEGAGGNGKSSFLTMISNFFGEENVTGLSLRDMEESFMISKLAKSMINITAETNKDDWGRVEKFKSVVSGDSMTFNEKFGRIWTGKCHSKLFIAANELNAPRDRSDALRRRVKIFPCIGSIISGKFKVKKDTSIKKAIDGNYEGISETLLSVLIPRLRQIMITENIFIPKRVEIHTTKRFWGNDTVLQFLLPRLFQPDMEDNFNFDDSDTNIDFLPDLHGVNINTQFKDYLMYCTDELSTPKHLSKKNFKNHLIVLYKGHLKIVEGRDRSGGDMVRIEQWFDNRRVEDIPLEEE